MFYNPISEVAYHYSSHIQAQLCFQVGSQKCILSHGNYQIDSIWLSSMVERGKKRGGEGKEERRGKGRRIESRGEGRGGEGKQKKEVEREDSSMWLGS